MYFEEATKLINEDAHRLIKMFSATKQAAKAVNKKNENIKNNNINVIMNDNEKWKDFVSQKFQPYDKNINSNLEEKSKKIKEVYNDKTDYKNNVLYNISKKTISDVIKRNAQGIDVHQGAQEEVIKLMSDQGKNKKDIYGNFRPKVLKPTNNKPPLLKNPIVLPKDDLDKLMKNYIWEDEGDFYINIPVGKMVLNNNMFFLNSADGILKIGKKIHVVEGKNGPNNENMSRYLNELSIAVRDTMNKTQNANVYSIGELYIVKDNGLDVESLKIRINNRTIKVSDININSDQDKKDILDYVNKKFIIKDEFNFSVYKEHASKDGNTSETIEDLEDAKKNIRDLYNDMIKNGTNNIRKIKRMLIAFDWSLRQLKEKKSIREKMSNKAAAYKSTHIISSSAFANKIKSINKCVLPIKNSEDFKNFINNNVSYNDKASKKEKNYDGVFKNTK